ncbi:nicotinate-nucleotide--dimethylbenzimidazole phosphoribosyltransferase [Actinocrinis puniceicyclus]|uniref:Nicotinate-nucleotide--dimethylbenzimidazole phosphoribosyltransferase n=1 Tax=Actinocrinis puniceicyclus TaxID=977794 RepID=A0A8J7WMF3_9ACTN|nr:nicotinate-nucleotide--dimethylbenzimidazole phosphoribosyltransferase [Actinocrinis puniceicyclus]MBS2963470.1 nicotinate-nucleotide--dimethylbenzimidazole phosphoribosyltransferase [Actinocrinis puniceicyclus]
MDTTELEKFAEGVTRPDEAAREAARVRWAETVALPPRSFGRIETLAQWLAAVQGACPPRQLEQARVVLFAGDHGIARHGVSANPPEATAALVRRISLGGGPVQALARTHQASVRVVDVSVDCDTSAFADLPAEVTAGRIRRGTGRIDQERACGRDEAAAAFRLGITLADAEIDSGADLLMPSLLGVGHSTPAGVLIGVLTGADAAAVTGRGSGIDDRAWIRKCAAVRDAMRAARPAIADQIELLATAAGPDFAAATGFILQAAIRRTPVLLDGIGSLACALLAQRIAFRTPDWQLAAHASAEPALQKAIDRLGLEPLLDFKVRADGGCAALLALPLLRSAVTILAETGSYADEGLPEPLMRSRL